MRNNERSRWRNQTNVIHILFNASTNDQLLHHGTRNFIYADNLCVTAQDLSFTQIERTIEEALDELSWNYNTLACQPCKDTQVSAFHLRNNETKITFKIEWNRVLQETIFQRN